MLKKTICYISTAAFLSLSAPAAMAAPREPGRMHTAPYNQEQYLVCQRRAQQLSGYYGPVPESHLPPGALHGAARGAAGGALIGVIGGSGVKTNKAAARGAALGAVAAGVRRAKVKSANDRKRDAYQFEVNACMSAH